MDMKKMRKIKIPGDFKIKNMKKDQLLILLLVGILLLVISVPVKKTDEEKDKDSYRGSQNSGENITSGNEYVSYLEEHLKHTLSQMEGAGNVEVMITLSSSEEKVVEKDREGESENISETDSQGGVRSTQNTLHKESTVYGNRENDVQTPYVSKEIMPRIEGVVVLAEGGDRSVVKKNITEAVQALFGIDTHKIRIIKKNETKR